MRFGFLVPFRSVLLLIFFSLELKIAQATPLDDFVADKTGYSWSLYDERHFDGYTQYRMNVISGDWLTAADVNRTEWKNFVNVFVPDAITTNSALLIIDGGNNSSVPSTGIDSYAGFLSTISGSVLVQVQTVPNQPLTFTGESKGRTEDALIAYSWEKYLETGDSRWPAQLPMTRSAVRAMDAVQELLGQVAGAGNPGPVDNFVVAGGSKRGWTTWLTAAVDSRVSSIIPMVIDTLNVEESFEHHHDVYGFWAPAIKDYVNAGVMEHLGTPEFKALMDIVDPYSYLDRLTMPKYMINASGDEFFVPDSSQFYFDDLLGENYIRYIPNVGHGLSDDPATILQVLSIYVAIATGVEIPTYTWDILPDGSITLDTDYPVSQVLLWQATNPNARDFRDNVVGDIFKSSVLEDLGNGHYFAHLPRPASGATAYFIEVAFDEPDGLSFKFTSGVSVVAVPETSSLVLMLVAGLLLAGYARHRRQTA